MNVCLIDPSKFISLTNPVSTISIPSIGLAYIAASVREAGHKVSFIDSSGSAPRQYHDFKGIRLRGLTNQEIISKIPKDTQVIGLSCMFTSHWVYVRELVAEIRSHFPDAFIMMGGEHVTGFPEYSMNQAPLDAVVTGEGEETVVEILNRTSKNQSLEEVHGVVYRDSDSNIIVNPRRNRISNIDSIPYPAWDLLNIDNYNEVNQPHGTSRGRFMPMLATRGCPFSCTFCTSPKMWTTQWTARDPKKVVDEMELYQQKYNATDFQFEDLTAIVQKSWVRDFCDEIIRREMNITFQLPSGTRSEGIDKEIAEKLKAAGCHEFAFAPESGDPRILKAIKKKVDLDSLFKSAKYAMNAGIKVGCFFIIGFPEDDYKSVFRTYLCIAKCGFRGFTNVNLNVYSPQPNTESFRQLQKEGVINELTDEYLLSLFTFQDFGAKKTSYNNRFSDTELSLLVWLGVMIFYFVYFSFRPHKVLLLIADMFSKSSTNKTNKVAKSVLKDLVALTRSKFSKAV
jgi:anaerobic magnesium-protoporphyrin IX monomethyl ester cyclase